MKRDNRAKPIAGTRGFVRLPSGLTIRPIVSAKQTRPISWLDGAVQPATVFSVLQDVEDQPRTARNVQLSSVAHSLRAVGSGGVPPTGDVTPTGTNDSVSFQSAVSVPS